MILGFTPDHLMGITEDGACILNNVLRTFFVKPANFRFRDRTGIWDAGLVLITILGNDCHGSESSYPESVVSVSCSW